MRSAAPAVSTSVISALAAPSSSRNVAMTKSLSPWSGFAGSTVSDDESRPYLALTLVQNRSRGDEGGEEGADRAVEDGVGEPSMSVGPPLTMTTRAPAALATGTQLAAG